MRWDAVRRFSRWPLCLGFAVTVAVLVASITYQLIWVGPEPQLRAFGVFHGAVWWVEGAPDPQGWKLKRSPSAGIVLMPITQPYTTAVPLWIPGLGFGIAAAFLFAPDMLAVRRRRIGRCVTCGYDRRGLGTDVACPECGTVPTK